jgi:hypothetical protein
MTSAAAAEDTIDATAGPGCAPTTDAERALEAVTALAPAPESGTAAEPVTPAPPSPYVLRIDLRELLDVDALLPHCTPSPFGDLRTNTTLVDTSVRAAQEMRADEGRPPVTAPVCRLEAPGVIRAVKKADPMLAPKQGYVGHQELLRPAPLLKHIAYASGSHLIPQRFTLLPSTLNVYSAPGGFFKPHMDSPSADSERMLGTLVMCLSSPFAGGELLVHPPKSTVAGLAEEPPTLHDWAPASGKGGQVQWAAFFGDCLHEVRPVTAGHRVTLTYLIMETPTRGVCIGKEGEVGKCPLFADLLHRVHSVADGRPVAVPVTRSSAERGHARAAQRVLAELRAQLPLHQCRLGILLSHRYTTLAADSGRVKGADSVLYQSLVDPAHGFQVEVKTVAHQSSEVMNNVYRGDKFSDNGYTHKRHTIYSLQRSDMAVLANKAKGELLPLPYDGRSLLLAELEQGFLERSRETSATTTKTGGTAPGCTGTAAADVGTRRTRTATASWMVRCTACLRLACRLCASTCATWNAYAAPR